MPDYRLRYVVPDFPTADDILPYLRQMDEARWYSNFGPLEHQFREALTRAFFPGLTSRHIVTACSGALAIETALIAHGFPQGARVLMPSYTFVATASAVVRAGYVPIFADIDAGTLALDPERAGHLARVLGCSAVVPVGVAGMAIPTAAWEAFADETGIAVIVDAAAGLGNQTISPLVTLAFSLHATKPFGIGEGGLVVSTREDIVAKARVATNFGLDRGRGVICGTNAKMSEYHSAVGIAQVARRDTIMQRRGAMLRTYRDAIARTAPAVKILTPVESHPANLIVEAPTPCAREIAAVLATAGIETRRLYNPPVHRHPAYLGYQCAEPMANTERMSPFSLSLPCHSAMSGQDVDEIVSLIAGVLD